MTKPRTGTMTERSPRHWRLQVAGDPDLITGERHRLSRTIVGNRTEAKEALQRLVVEAGAGLHGDSGTTVGVLLEMFMATATLAPSTRADWESVVNRHLLPELGHLPLWKLTARDCDRLYARMAADGLGPSRCKCTHVVLHRVVAQAVRWGWLIRNPVSDATRPEVPRTEINPPSAATVRVLLDAARTTDEVLHCWLQIAVATGARRGELCALRWCDFDLDARTVRIERSVSATKKHGIFIKTTKTGRVRLVSITAHAVNALGAQRDRAVLSAAEADRQVQPADLVFTSDPAAQRPWRPELVTRRWERLRKRTGHRGVRIHDLRHFVATELLTAGIDVRTVANRLGHARTSTTLDIYWAWVPARDRDAAEHLERLIEARP
jgi:integrase